MFSKNLQTLRKENHYTQEQLAEKLGVSRQVIAKWENEDSTPDIVTGTKLASIFKVTLDELVGENDYVEAKSSVHEGKYIFGTVTIGERGQIVIPKKAREVFHLKPGDDLLVLGDINQGLALVYANDFLAAITELRRAVKGETNECNRN